MLFLNKKFGATNQGIADLFCDIFKIAVRPKDIEFILHDAKHSTKLKKYLVRGLGELGFKTAEIADMLEISEANVYYHLRKEPKRLYFNGYLASLVKSADRIAAQKLWDGYNRADHMEKTYDNATY